MQTAAVGKEGEQRTVKGSGYVSSNKRLLVMTIRRPDYFVIDTAPWTIQRLLTTSWPHKRTNQTLILQEKNVIGE